MATAATPAVKSIKRDIPFAWEGRDKKGNRVKGKSRRARRGGAAQPSCAARASPPSRIRKQRSA